MANSSFFGESSQIASEHPHYLPLTGISASQTKALILRKGRMLNPPLSDADAQKMMAFMCLEHFKPSQIITFSSRNDDTSRLMLIIAGEANIRMRSQVGANRTADNSPLGQVQSKWFNASEGSTLGLVHAFSGLSSRFVAQVASEMFVASLSRLALQQMKRQEPLIAMRFMEMAVLELALVAIEHEKNLVAISSVARSMQSHINDESGETGPAELN